jgi:hypothetical protein
MVLVGGVVVFVLVRTLETGEGSAQSVQATALDKFGEAVQARDGAATLDLGSTLPGGEPTEPQATETPQERTTSSTPHEKGEASGEPNRLIAEKSPYLLQHAHNPLDWYPWGPEAFEKARRENKPIFSSIGYSTCHWCHVMEAESFEDADVARSLNETFVAIKVDREERPDIDNHYMNVAMMMARSGGWPLNVMLTPNMKPFFASTYIPKENRFGRMGMLELIPLLPSTPVAWRPP